jgi:hypothetical protein
MLLEQRCERLLRDANAGWRRYDGTMHPAFALPTIAKVTGRKSTITGMFFAALTPVIEPTDAEVRQVLRVLGMKDGAVALRTGWLSPSEPQGRRDRAPAKATTFAARATFGLVVGDTWPVR